MRRRHYVWLSAVTLCVTAAALPASASASADSRHGSVALFPSNTDTVRDRSQRTGLRVALPMPDCTASPTDCATVAQLNQLDGFDIDPRISLTFDHAVDAAAVAAETTVTALNTPHAAAIGVDRVVWDATTNTVYAHPLTQLAPDTTYLLRLHGPTA